MKLQKAVEHYRERTGHYPVRILADTIYRNRNNLSYCKSRGIRLSGPALGRPKKNCIVDKKQEYNDAVDRIEVERKFSLVKRCFGLGLIKTKLDTTTMSSVSLSIIAMNVDRLLSCSFFDFIRYISESVFRVVFRILIADTGDKRVWRWGRFKGRLMSRQ